MATFTKRDLIDELAEKVGLSKRKTGVFLDELAEIAYREAKTPAGFTMPGLCKIDMGKRKERHARNPRTKETLLIAAHDVVRIRPLKKAKDAIAPLPPNYITILPDEEVAKPAVAAPVPAVPAADPAADPAAAIAPAPAPAPAAPAPAAVPVADVKMPEGFFGFNCPFCNVIIEASKEMVGSAASCPDCGKNFTVPAPGEAAKPFEPALAQAIPAEPVDEDNHLVSFRCKHCGQEIEAPFDMAGSEDQCPTCGEMIEIPYLSEEGTTQALWEEKASDALVEAAKSKTLRIELPDDL